MYGRSFSMRLSAEARDLAIASQSRTARLGLRTRIALIPSGHAWCGEMRMDRSGARGAARVCAVRAGPPARQLLREPPDPRELRPTDQLEILYTLDQAEIPTFQERRLSGSQETRAKDRRGGRKPRRRGRRRAARPERGRTAAARDQPGTGWPRDPAAEPPLSCCRIGSARRAVDGRGPHLRRPTGPGDCARPGAGDRADVRLAAAPAATRPTASPTTRASTRRTWSASATRPSPPRRATAHVRPGRRGAQPGTVPGGLGGAAAALVGGRVRGVVPGRRGRRGGLPPLPSRLIRLGSGARSLAGTRQGDGRGLSGGCPRDRARRHRARGGDDGDPHDRASSRSAW